MEPFSRIFRHKKRTEMAVDDEAQFHIETQSLAYDGLSSEESQVMAKSRFVELEETKKEFNRLSPGKRFVVWSLNSIFVLSLFVGLFLRIAIPESNLDRVGDCLMMIGGLGILLVYIKQAGAFVLRSGSEPFRLGLNKYSPPIGFDEQGRSPFDRVRQK